MAQTAGKARRRRELLAVVFILTGPGGAVAGTQAPEPEARLEALEERVARIEQGLERIVEQLARLGDASQQAGGMQRAVAELAVATHGVAGELATTGAAPSTRSVQGAPRTQPPASSDDPGGGAQRAPYGGYMELHFNEDDFEPSTLDFHRFVLLFGHQFTDRIRFVGELEVEHALVEGGEESGELELEQGYLDFLVAPSVSARAGMMLTPMGIVNERHEPASFHGVERPFVDTFIIPSTWFANGAGVVSQFGNGFTLKAFAMSTLNGAQFNAEEGFREGRQKGFFDDASNLAASLRLEYAATSDLDLGLSYWTGNTGFEFDLGARTRLVELDAQYRVGRLDLRGEWVSTELEDSVELNRAIERRTGINPNNAEEMRGFYLEGAVHLLPRRSRSDLVAFYRFEDFDTQYKMAPGLLPLERFDRNAHVLGLTYLPHPDVAIKGDYVILDNESEVFDAGEKWNLGIGWWF